MYLELRWNSNFSKIWWTIHYSLSLSLYIYIERQREREREKEREREREKPTHRFIHLLNSLNTSFFMFVLFRLFLQHFPNFHIFTPLLGWKTFQFPSHTLKHRHGSFSFVLLHYLPVLDEAKSVSFRTRNKVTQHRQRVDVYLNICMEKFRKCRHKRSRNTFQSSCLKITK